MYIVDKFPMRASDFATMNVVCTFRKPSGYVFTMSTLSLQGFWQFNSFAKRAGKRKVNTAKVSYTA